MGCGRKPTLENGQLTVTQSAYGAVGNPPDDPVRAVGGIEIIDSELVVFGIDRTIPEMEASETSE